MTKKCVSSAIAVLLGTVATSLNAAVITASQVGTSGVPTRVATAEESAGTGPAPVGAEVYQFQVTTDADILGVTGVLVALDGGRTLFNHPNGNASNAEPGDPFFITLIPALGVDSWITTPGATSRLGADLPGDGVDTTFGDTTDEGPQTNFVFAQLTVPAMTTGTFSGFLSIKGTPDAFTQAFSFPIGIPEPASIALGAMGLLGFVALRRRVA